MKNLLIAKIQEVGNGSIIDFMVGREKVKQFQQKH